MDMIFSIRHPKLVAHTCGRISSASVIPSEVEESVSIQRSFFKPIPQLRLGNVYFQGAIIRLGSVRNDK